MDTRIFTTLLRAGLAGLFLAPHAQASQDAPAPTGEPEPYWRVAESAGGSEVSLEVAVRRFVPVEGDGPSISLAAAVHIGEPAFYELLQRKLDAMDLVLFEGVKPSGAGEEAHEINELDDTDRAAITRRRLRFVGSVAERQRSVTGRYAASLDELTRNAPGRISALLETATLDAWGRPLVYEPEAASFALRSRGADALDAADDLRLADQPPLTPMEIEPDAEEGIQQKLAGALGLVFQLDAMNHDGDNWRNSDLSLDQLAERLERAGADGGQLFDMMGGQSFGAKLAGLVLSLMKLSPAMGAMGRLVLIEMLAEADEMMGAMPGELGAMMDVILEERNDVVIADLREQIAANGHGRIGVIYGAGHLEGIERALVDELGYKPERDAWLRAISVRAADAGLDARSMTQMRAMMSRMLDMQLRQMKQMRPAQPAPAR